jgi:3-keto-disaccharide hydrolase
MRRLLPCGVIFAALCGAQSAPNTLTSKEATEGWVMLFDGASLKGWQGRATSAPNTTGDWIVENGAIVGRGTVPSWLSSDASFSDYELKLEFRGGEKVNSGVFLRSQKEGQPHITGYELQIWDYQPQGYLTGSLVNSLKSAPTKILPDQWNSYDITATGDHFVVVLNGKTLLDAHDGKHASGVIGFQCQKDNRIEFRNIKLRPIKK